MPAKKHHDVHTHEKILAFLQDRNLSPKSNRGYISAIGRYIEFRAITVDELIENGEKEITFLEEIGKNPVYGTKVPIVVRGLLRFYGHQIPMPARNAKLFWYFIEDEYMEQFVRFHRKLATKKHANRALADFCSILFGMNMPFNFFFFIHLT